MIKDMIEQSFNRAFSLGDQGPNLRPIQDVERDVQNRIQEHNDRLNAEIAEVMK